MAQNKNYVPEPEIEEEADIITLEFDNDESVECEILGIFDFEKKDYIALIPDNGTDDVYLYEYIDHGEEFELKDIDEKLFPRVVEEFDKIMAEQEE